MTTLLGTERCSLEGALGGEGFFWVTAQEQGRWVTGTWTAQLDQMGVDHRTPPSAVWALPAPEWDYFLAFPNLEWLPVALDNSQLSLIYFPE